MDKLEPKDYINAVRYIDGSCCGEVYPRSIAEEIQQGDIFINSRSALFWHYSGFAFTYGDYDENFLDSIYDTFLSGKSEVSRRFILFASNENVKRFLSEKENIVSERRYFFEYRKDYLANTSILPDGYELCEIDKELLDKINGNITPFFSWNNSTDFLKKGKGYCVVKGGRAAAWAFTAAISKEEIDIGIETDSEFQHLGLGTIAANKMIQYSFEQHKRPVWACHSNNIASQKLAEKLGFVKISECCTIRKQ